MVRRIEGGTGDTDWRISIPAIRKIYCVDCGACIETLRGDAVCRCKFCGKWMNLDQDEK